MDQLDLLRGGVCYRCIAIDPPWPETGGGGRGAQSHYHVMSVDRIIATVLELPCWRVDPTFCHLHLWVTNTHLLEGGRVLDALGFRYITMRTWLKDAISIGQYCRGETEHVLIGVRGVSVLPEPSKRLTTVIGGGVVPVPRDANGNRIHSAKPQIAFDEIRQISEGPYLELFARGARAGWDVYGHLDGEEHPPVFEHAA